MLLRAFFAAIITVAVPAAAGEAHRELELAQAGPAFLDSDQIVLLLVGTEVTHRPPGGRGTAHMSFTESGAVRIQGAKGNRNTGSWAISAPGILCLKNLGGRGDKNFCVRLVREGNEIHHYVPTTGESMNVPPWVIVSPGPGAGQVPGG